jgi:hypothetical protein
MLASPVRTREERRSRFISNSEEMVVEVNLQAEA